MSKPKLRLAEADDFSQDVLARLKVHFEVISEPCEERDISEILNNFDVFWFRLKYQINEQVIPDSPRCKVIASPVTGIDHIDEQTCSQKGIQIISLRGEVDFLREVRATAELTLLLTLMALRPVNEAIEHVRSGEWNRDLFRGGEIYGKKVGIIGVGRLGEITASYFLAMGAEVYGYDRKEFTSPGIKRVNDILEIAATCDIVSIHLSLTEATRGIIDGFFFRTMKPHAILINTSRGAIIDEMALLEALKSKLIAKACVDVVANEHVISKGKNALVEYAANADNLLITPHIGGNTFESFQKTESFIADKVIHHFTTVGKNYG